MNSPRRDSSCPVAPSLTPSLARPFALSLVAIVLGACGSSTPSVAPPPVASVAAPEAPTLDASPANALSMTTPDASAKDSSTEATDSMSTSMNELSARLVRALHGEKGNLFFSGASIRAALGMTALGAKGKTLDEMAQALGVDADPQKNAANAKMEMDAWKAAAGKSELVIANRVWVEKKYPIEKAFLGEAESGYGASAVPVDFSGAPDPSRQRINAWVLETTKGKIRNLLPPGSITPLARLVLTNAIYFKATWLRPFEKSSTKDEPFATDAGAVTTPMMHRSGLMGYAENEDVRLVELPYKDSDLSFVAVLPQKADQLGALEGKLTALDLDAWTKALAMKHVALGMPKFTFSWGRSVKPELETLGMRAAFTDGDFSGISAKNDPPFYLSDVVHKAFVLVDETGTEAAAATGGVMTTRAFVRNIELKLDRPFLFFVRNAKTGDVLFAGRMANPRT